MYSSPWYLISVKSSFSASANVTRWSGVSQPWQTIHTAHFLWDSTQKPRDEWCSQTINLAYFSANTLRKCYFFFAAGQEKKRGNKMNESVKEGWQRPVLEMQDLSKRRLARVS